MGFTFVSGDTALDFAGTLRYRTSVREELLAAPADLSRWLREAGVLDEEVLVTEAVFADAVELREAVYALALAKILGEPLPQGPRVLLNRWANESRTTLQLGASGGIRRSGEARQALATLALTAVRVLGGDVALRQCESSTCTRVFVDRSHRHGRRWCDMAECGNRDKARAYRSRRAGQAV